jgi:hypothetical protein
MSFVRKNAITVTASFAADDGTTTQPSSVICALVYPNLSGNQQTEQITLTYDPVNNIWVGVWDSNVAGQGVVSWVIYGSGTLQAADQGDFEVLANRANTF